MSPRQGALTLEEIVAAALRLVDEDGLDALSMRRLGAALGVEAMALYRHVPNKEALLDLTVERMRSEMQLDGLEEDDPADLMTAIFAEYRRVLTAHPNMLPLATRRTDTDSPSGLSYLIDQGVGPEDAIELYQSLMAFTIGFSVLGSQRAGGDWSGIPEDLAERLRDWRDVTFRRTLTAVMSGYGLIGRKDRK
jgi:TetR/AcrR family tetracycline transcriptional repressor